MQKSEQTGLFTIERIIQERYKSAKMRVKNTQDELMKRYYKGQLDALTIALRDLDTMKFEHGYELEPETEPIIFSPSPVKPVAEKIEEPKKPEKKPAVKPEPKKPLESPYKDLVREAIGKKVITQRFSRFYHPALPQNGVKGFRALYQALEENSAFRQSVEDACALSPQAEPIQMEQPVEAQNQEGNV